MIRIFFLALTQRKQYYSREYAIFKLTASARFPSPISRLFINYETLQHYEEGVGNRRNQSWAVFCFQVLLRAWRFALTGTRTQVSFERADNGRRRSLRGIRVEFGLRLLSRAEDVREEQILNDK